MRVSVPAQLIRIRELGETVDVSSRFEDLAASLVNCSLESDLDFESALWSNRCKLPIGETAPERKALEIFGAMDASMREYNRRLSTSPQTDTLINLIRAAGPSSLENVLDEGVITFIKGFMK